MAVLPARTISVSIDRDPDTVYAFVSDPRNLPHWARNFARSVRQDGDGWTVETADGPVRVAFADANELGVTDHLVTGADGAAVLIPMRVLANGDGAEVIFTLFRANGTSQAEFERDEALVTADLQALQELLTTGPAR